MHTISLVPTKKQACGRYWMNQHNILTLSFHNIPLKSNIGPRLHSLISCRARIWTQVCVPLKPIHLSLFCTHCFALLSWLWFWTSSKHLLQPHQRQDMISLPKGVFPGWPYPTHPAFHLLQKEFWRSIQCSLPKAEETAGAGSRNEILCPGE